jgi:hypothetical protein
MNKKVVERAVALPRLSEIETNKLIPDPENARRHPQPNREAIKRSIQQFGIRRPIVASESTNIVYAGNGVLEAALELGIEKIPVAWIPSGTPVELCKAYAIADNRSAELAEWDPTQLEKLIASMPTMELANMGFDEEGLKQIINQKPIDDKEETFDVGAAIEKDSELCSKWDVDYGKKYRVGRHFVMCGDSTKKEDVASLIGNQQIELICTDPPYDLLCEVAINVFDYFGNRAIIVSGGKQAFSFIGNEWEYHGDLIWKRRASRSFPTEYQPVFYHNNIILMSKKDTPMGWKRPTQNFGSIIEIEGNEYETEFGHGKSHKLFVEMLRGFDFKFIGDPFSGSGASLMACEALGKTCFGMELKKEIVAIALERCLAYGLDIVHI